MHTNSRDRMICFPGYMVRRFNFRVESMYFLVLRVNKDGYITFVVTARESSKAAFLSLV